MNIIKPKTKEVDKQKLDYILSTRTVKSLREITNNNFLITYTPIVNEEICLAHGIDPVSVLNRESNFNLEKNIEIFKDVSIAISAMVTSYARIEMHKLKLQILSLGGKIYYSDTDSIVTNIKLESLKTKNLVGKGIGQYKLEYDIREAYFISNKTYCYILQDGSPIIKAKGVLSHSLTVEDFKRMYYLSENVLATKVQTITNYQQGSVLIKNKEVLLNPNAYSKRIKLYTSEKSNSHLDGIKQLWTNTQPLILNNIEKRITIYKENLSTYP